MRQCLWSFAQQDTFPGWRSGNILEIEDMEQILLTCPRHKFAWDITDGRPVSALGCGPVACAPSSVTTPLPPRPPFESGFRQIVPCVASSAFSPPPF